jgi:c-di-GMP phosphodiesterase
MQGKNNSAAENLNQSQDNPENKVFLGRQAIFDKDQKVAAYELLFRSGDQNAAFIDDHDLATNTVINNIFAELDINEVVGNKDVFINFPRNLILDPPPLPPERVVIELLEDIKVDDEIVESVKNLSKMGFRIALDDFQMTPGMDRLLPYADIIKVDLMNPPSDNMEEFTASIKKYRCITLAEKVETHEEYEQYKAMGYDLFQGYFLCKPNLVSGSKASSDKLTLMNLVAEINKPDCNIDELEQILARDPTLTYKILKIINSAYFAKASKIESLQQAIVYMGLNELRKWAAIIAVNSVESSPEVLLTAMIRAKMCEQIAEKDGDTESSKYFLAGLFSMLDAMLNEDMDSILSKVSLSDEIQEAVCSKSGKIGVALQDVICYEKTDFEHISEEHCPIMKEAFMNSISWGEEVCRASK